VKHDTEASGLAFTGDPELIRLAFDCGIGAKNSQGFGMIAPVKYERPSATSERWSDERREAEGVE
jgi:hypothetical protein